MKLNKSKKKSAGRNQPQEHYPKVKTFSKAYDFSSEKKAAPAVPSGNMPPFISDERPYPIVHSADLPEIPNITENYSDPERIDLQDTLLTDESFVGGPLKPSVAVSSDCASDSSAVPEKLEEDSLSFKAEEPEENWSANKEEEIREEQELEEDLTADEEADFWSAEKPELFETPEEDDRDTESSFFEPKSANDTETPYVSDPEAEYEADSFFESEEDTGLEPALFSGTDTISNPEPVKEPEEETFEPFSWFESDADAEPEDSAGFSFMKKKYTAVIGEKKNLRKKLRSKPKGSLKWKSSDTKIAKVSKKGILKPKKKGKVTIRVKAKGGERAKVKIRVRSAKKPKTMPWESVGTEKKAVTDKKWARFA